MALLAHYLAYVESASLSEDGRQTVKTSACRATPSI